MRTYSRRDFLKLTGITLATSQINLFPNLQASFTQHAFQGRAFRAAPIYKTADTASGIIGTLWPDSVSRIQGLNGNWYRLANGYVERSELQPMFVDSSPLTVQIPTVPFWAEVISPVATVHQYCAANAPLITRIGHGGVTQVIDYLPGEPDGWYGISADNGTLKGWTQAVYWLPIREIANSTDLYAVKVDLNTQTLSVEQDGKTVLQTLCSIDPGIKTGAYELEQQKPGGTHQFPQNANSFHGAPWQLDFGAGGKLMGVYWHNQFGTAWQGPAVQVPPFVARWLYTNMTIGSRMIVN